MNKTVQIILIQIVIRISLSAYANICSSTDKRKSQVSNLGTHAYLLGKGGFGTVYGNGLEAYKDLIVNDSDLAFATNEIEKLIVFQNHF